MSPSEADSAAGLASRKTTSLVLQAVLDKRRPLDEALTQIRADTSARDRGFTRLVVATVLRRLGEIDFVLAQFIDTDLPPRAGIAPHILRAAAAEILFLDVKPHAAVSAAVELAAQDRQARHFKALVNAVLRRTAEEGKALIARADAERLNLPEWLWASWTRAYGEKTTRAIIRAHCAVPPLDLSVKQAEERALWSEKLNARRLPTGTLRLVDAPRVESLPGFAEGAWWVQDAAAALPTKLFGALAGEDVLDLCAAPGGKTAALAAQGAHVTALDRSGARLRRLQENLQRLNLQAGIVETDAAIYDPKRQWKHILLDAPCSATGTARRHPDVLRLKSPSDRDKLAEIQARLLEHAAILLAPRGTLIYCTCSLEPEEGPEQIEIFLRAHPDFVRKPIAPLEIGGMDELVTREGDLRTLPSHMEALGGMDGFYAARLMRKA